MLIGKLGVALGEHKQRFEVKQTYLDRYNPNVYIPLMKHIFDPITKNGKGCVRIVIGTGNLNSDRNKLFERGYPSDYSLVALQVFCKSQEPNGESYFHTFVLIKNDNGWYIGDNEVGLLSGITKITDEDILSDTINFNSTLPSRNWIRGTQSPHNRIYQLNGKVVDLEYFGTQHMTTAYTNAREVAYFKADESWAFRKYILFRKDCFNQNYSSTSSNTTISPSTVYYPNSRGVIIPSTVPTSSFSASTVPTPSFSASTTTTPTWSTRASFPRGTPRLRNSKLFGSKKGKNVRFGGKRSKRTKTYKHRK
jgi:hypothetical protein